MAYFVVTRERRAGWKASRSMREQDRWDEHKAFMNALVDEGVIVLGGPLGDGTTTLLVADTQDEDEIRTRLADDPWTTMGLLRIAAIQPWEVLLGEPAGGTPR